MKRHIILLVAIFGINCMVYTNAFGDQKPYYAIAVFTSGDNAFVDAIKQYSDLTKADENSWKFSWMPGVAAFTRWRVMSKVEEYLKVCRGIYVAKTINFDSYTPAQNCNAFDNLDQQGEIALALLGQVRADRIAHAALYQELEKFIATNRKLKMHFNCSSVKREQGKIVQKELKKAETQLKTNKAWWEIQALRWKMAKSMGSTAFQGAKWIAQTINENSTPLISAAAAWYIYDRLFGTRRPAK